MATFGGNEKQSLGSFVKSQTKYGTTTTVASKNRSSTYIKHSLVSGDTLPRLALKYSVTVEQIKRDNKLWTNDSIFLKEFVFIPVTRENTELIPESAVIVGSDVVRAALNLHVSQKQEKTRTEIDYLQSDTQTDSHAEFSNTPIVRNGSGLSDNQSESESKSAKSKTSALDFLSKYDSSIAQLKTNVDKMKQNAAFLETDFPMAASWFPRRHTEGNVSSPGNSRLQKHHSYEIDPDSSPILVIRSRTKDVQSSLERLEKKNDDFYQL